MTREQQITQASQGRFPEWGEPADLILESLRFAYRKLGRDRIIELIKEGKTEKEIKALGNKKN